MLLPQILQPQKSNGSLGVILMRRFKYSDASVQPLLVASMKAVLPVIRNK